MAFPKRGTRKLTVDGRVFLWHLRPRDLDYGAVATVRAEDGGPLLHYWPADFYPSPSEAAHVIRAALVDGWDERGRHEICWVARSDDGLFVSDERPPPPWQPMRQSPFADLEVPVSSEAISKETLEWVLPFYLRRIDEPGWADEMRLRLSALDQDLVRQLLSFPNWRPRIVGGYLAAIGGYVALEEQLGRLLLRSDLCYAGRGYALALASFDTSQSLGFLTRYLDHYLDQEELWFDQGDVMAAVVLLDRLHGTHHADEHRDRWDRFVANKPSWSLERFVERFERSLGVLRALRER